MAIQSEIKVCECWARDGLQSIPKVIPTPEKIEMVNRIIASGVKKLEVTSFSHPKLLPQFADCVEVLKQIDRHDDGSYVALMPNAKGFNRFEQCVKEGYGADEIILMISASVAHNTVNFRMDHQTAMKAHAASSGMQQPDPETSLGDVIRRRPNQNPIIQHALCSHLSVDTSLFTASESHVERGVAANVQVQARSRPFHRTHLLFTPPFTPPIHTRSHSHLLPLVTPPLFTPPQPQGQIGRGDGLAPLRAWDA